MIPALSTLCFVLRAVPAKLDARTPPPTPHLEKNVNDLHSNPYLVLRRVLVGVYLRAAPWLVSRVSMCGPLSRVYCVCECDDLPCNVSVREACVVGNLHER